MRCIYCNHNDSRSEYRVVNYCSQCGKMSKTFISQVLHTDEGRIALAKAMTEPIRRHLEYQGIGRRVLQIDALPDA